MKGAWPVATAFAALSSSKSAFAQILNPMKSPNERFVLNAQQSLALIDAVAANATANNAPSTIVVADPYGYPIAAVRMDNAYLESFDTCIRKARAVSLFNGAFTSGELGPFIQPGSEDYGLEHTNGGLLFVPGAIPLYINGTFFAAVGVCGGTGQQDIEAATAGILAIGGSLTP